MEMDRQFRRNQVGQGNSSSPSPFFLADLEWLIVYCRALLRCILFYGTNKRMVLHPTHFIRNVDPVSLDVLEQEKFELLTLDPRTGTALSSTSIDHQQSNRSGRWAQFAELLWILRPFVYGSTF
jgi:hypothetical protein